MKGRIEKFGDQIFYYNINAVSGSPVIYKAKTGTIELLDTYIQTASPKLM